MDLKPGWERRWILQNASRLADLRDKRRISRNLLADEARLNVSQIWRAEKGQDIRLSTLLKLLDGLGYRFELDLQEICEEAGDLLSDEKRRRDERRDAARSRGRLWY